MSESPESITNLSSTSYAYAPSSESALSNSESPPDLAAASQRHPHTQSQHESSTSPSQASNSTPAPPPIEKPFHSKRPHRKSRAGCKNCKARKVKCDEVRPTCRSCRLRKAECVYPDPPANTSASSTTQSTSSSTVSRASHKAAVRLASTSANSPASAAGSASFNVPFHPSPHQSPAALGSSIFADPVFTTFDPDDDLNLTVPDDPLAGLDFGDPSYDATTPLMVVSGPLFKPVPSFDDTDMKLMWWYTSQTATSFSLGADKSIITPGVNIMRGQLVQLAFTNPFLLDSLYALTAQHLSQLDPSGSTIDYKRAMYYRQKSYLGYRKAIEAGDPATFPALLANSLLLCALSSSTFRDPEAPDLYIIDWMVVWKGIGLIVGLISVPALVASGLQPLFYRPPTNLDNSASAIPNNLLFMVSSMPSTDIDYEDREVYYNTLKHLGSLLHHLRDGGVNPIMGLRIVTIFTFVPGRFVELARLRRPRTLVILAYYAIFFKLIPVVWWTEGIGQRTLRDICKHLGPDWHHLLRAPMMAIHVDEPNDLIRLLLEDPTWQPPGDEYGTQWVAQIRELSWVDNAGRKMVLQPEEDRMVARETPDGPDLLPYFDKDCSPQDPTKYPTDHGNISMSVPDTPKEGIAWPGSTMDFGMEFHGGNGFVPAEGKL
ncbi:fungal zn(2)-Cys(6) binuclear cluster domain-containing protein [Sarocladium implicatum]|nr:fungal zn(2)-Cys(6) binuclear cluster domain-containing protein [Sarocladium implicatum]